MKREDRLVWTNDDGKQDLLRTTAGGDYIVVPDYYTRAELAELRRAIVDALDGPAAGES